MKNFSSKRRFLKKNFFSSFKTFFQLSIIYFQTKQCYDFWIAWFFWCIVTDRFCHYLSKHVLALRSDIIKINSLKAKLKLVPSRKLCVPKLELVSFCCCHDWLFLLKNFCLMLVDLDISNERIWPHSKVALWWANEKSGLKIDCPKLEKMFGLLAGLMFQQILVHQNCN